MIRTLLVSWSIALPGAALTTVLLDLSAGDAFLTGMAWGVVGFAIGMLLVPPDLY